MNKGVSPTQLIRLLGVMNPIMQAVSELQKPDGYLTELIEDKKNDRWVVLLKVAYTKKSDAEKFIELDKMIDNV